ncbi:MAG TPA: GGDEF domain-containing protein, partial [Gemmatirosa sp.]
MENLHPLLRRQWHRHVGRDAAPPAELEALLRAVSGAYDEFDHKRRLVERALALSSAELHTLNTELTRRALHDPLTGLANRSLFQDRVAHALAHASRQPGTVALLYLDLDDFKPVNDSLGHAAGDALLVAVAERLRSATRGCDTVARLGGDEFAVLLEQVRDGAEAVIVADRVLA